MKLKNLFDQLKVDWNVEAPTCWEQEITGITDDSRQVKPGNLFIARSGTQLSGHQFIASALANGAIAILGEGGIPDHGVPTGQTDDLGNLSLELARRFYGKDQEKLKVVGVTGTDGKTSFTYICESLLLSLGKKVGVIGTVNARYNNKIIEVSNTTPSFWQLQQLLADMVADGVDYVIMEVSSHSLVQKRVAGISFSVTVFTNLKQDHLDYHHNMEEYFCSKKLLFSLYGRDSQKVINGDDEYGQTLLAEFKDAHGVGQEQSNAFPLSNCLNNTSYSSFSLGNIFVKTNLLGRFNIYNVAQAILAVHFLGFELADLASAVLKQKIVIPGRLQSVVPGVYVDYAHTPNALEKVLEALRGFGYQKIITIFGCGGDRDKGKRPLMGEVASRLSDKCIVTSDNPRSERPELIIGDIMKGISNSAAIIVSDRREAIALGVRLVNDDKTCLLIAGKGHENYQIIADRVLHHDDVECARKEVDRCQRKLLLLGYGVSGKAVVDWAVKHAWEVDIYDRKELSLKEDILSTHVPSVRNIFCDEQLADVDLSCYDFIVFSPGMKLSPALFAEYQHNCKMMNEIDFAYLHSRGPFHVVTGTNGKTTTTSMLNFLLLQNGISAVAAGNIGYPLTLAVLENNADVEMNYVVELSSFQIETLKYFTCDSLIFLNLAPDHLDSYACAEEYYLAKKTVFSRTHAATKVINGLLLDWGNEEQKMPERWKVLFARHQQKFINLQNTIAVLYLCQELGLDCQKLIDFTPPVHRMELVISQDGISIYNDSKSTNLHSLSNALSFFQGNQELLLLISGKNKNEDFSHVILEIKNKAKKVFLSGGAVSFIEPLLRQAKIPYACADHLVDICRMASAEALAGDIILLSPGLPSFDEFRNFEERGEVFKKIIKDIWCK